MIVSFHGQGLNIQSKTGAGAGRFANECCQVSLNSLGLVANHGGIDVFADGQRLGPQATELHFPNPSWLGSNHLN
jgi:hypothetical protein